MPDGAPAGGCYPEHRITVEAALRHYTRDAAYASFDEPGKGTMRRQVADFAVLSNHMLGIAPTEHLATPVLLTVMGGR